MIGIVKLGIKIQLVTSQDEVDTLKHDIIKAVAEHCFAKYHRRVLEADIIDIELADDDIDAIKMLDARRIVEKEAPVETEKGTNEFHKPELT